MGMAMEEEDLGALVGIQEKCKCDTRTIIFSNAYETSCRIFCTIVVIHIQVKFTQSGTGKKGC